MLDLLGGDALLATASASTYRTDLERAGMKVEMPPCAFLLSRRPASAVAVTDAAALPQTDPLAGLKRSSTWWSS